jgi:hypothetical protein
MQYSQQPQEALGLLVKEERCWALFYMPLYTFLHSLLNVLVQIANKIGLQKKTVYNEQAQCHDEMFEWLPAHSPSLSGATLHQLLPYPWRNDSVFDL